MRGSGRRRGGRLNHLEASREELIAAARSIAAVSYREEIRAMMKAGTLDEED